MFVERRGPYELHENGDRRILILETDLFEWLETAQGSVLRLSRHGIPEGRVIEQGRFLYLAPERGSESQAHYLALNPMFQSNGIEAPCYRLPEGLPLDFDRQTPIETLHEANAMEEIQPYLSAP